MPNTAHEWLLKTDSECWINMFNQGIKCMCFICYIRSILFISTFLSHTPTQTKDHFVVTTCCLLIQNRGKKQHCETSIKLKSTWNIKSLYMKKKSTGILMYLVVWLVSLTLDDIVHFGVCSKAYALLNLSVTTICQNEMSKKQAALTQEIWLVTNTNLFKEYFSFLFKCKTLQICSQSQPHN